MGKTIIFKNANRNFIFYRNQKYIYEQYSGRIEEYYKIEELLDNELLLNKIIENGFDSYEKEFEGRDKEVWKNGAVTPAAQSLPTLSNNVKKPI